MLKRSKRMKISSSLKEFCEKYNIPSIVLHFVGDSQVDLVFGSFDE